MSTALDYGVMTTSMIDRLSNNRGNNSDNTHRNSDNIKRIPFPALTDLPSGLQTTAKMLGNMMTYHAHQHLLRNLIINHYGNMYASNQSEFIAEIAKEDDSIVRKRKSYYAGVLQIQQINGGYYNVGVYNPDRIPIGVYEKMKRHAQIALSLAVIKKPIEHVSFSLECDSPEVKAFVAWNLKLIYTNLIRDLLLSLDYGSSFNEKVWIRIPKLIISMRSADGEVKKVFDQEALALKTYAVHPSSITLLLDKHGELIGIKQRSITNTWKEVKIKRRKLIVKVNNMEFGNWWGDARLKSAYTWWYWSEICLQFMIRYLERRSSPPIIIEAPMGKSIRNIKGTVEQVDNLDYGLALGQGLVSNSVGVLPQQYTNEGKPMWNIRLLSDDQRIFMFIEVLIYFNSMINRSLWVPDNVSAQESSGPAATTDARTDTHLVIEEALIRELEYVLNEDVIPDMIKNNFPPERRATCYVTIEKLTITRKLMLKELLMKMMGVVNQFARDGGLFKYIPDLTEILKLLEIPMAKTEDIINLEDWMPGGGGGDDEDDDNTKEEKVKENNKNKIRPVRTRIQKRKKTIA